MFERVISLVGESNFKKIQNTTVLVVGLGGVGGYALESIVRSGIQNLIIVDADTIESSNLNRQLISLQSNIGEKKVDAFEKRILDINPNAKIKKIDQYITEENINLLFEEKIDYLIDACDTVPTKKLIIKQCINKKIPMISCMGMGRKLDISKIKVQDIRKTSYDPIAKKIRRMINEEHIKEKVMVVSSTEQPVTNTKKHISSNSFVPAVAGINCASYIIHLIIGG